MQQVVPVSLGMKIGGGAADAVKQHVESCFAKTIEVVEKALPKNCITLSGEEARAELPAHFYDHGFFQATRGDYRVSAMNWRGQMELPDDPPNFTVKLYKGEELQAEFSGSAFNSDISGMRSREAILSRDVYTLLQYRSWADTPDELTKHLTDHIARLQEHYPSVRPFPMFANGPLLEGLL